jgi:hypothetical protein
MPTPTDCRKCGRPYYGAAGLLCDECEREAKRPLDAADCSLSLAELLAWADEECAKIECESWPIADTGDYDSAWCVYAHHLNEKDARCVGGGPTIERALRAAWIEEHSPENEKSPSTGATE